MKPNKIWSSRAEALIDPEQSPVYLGSTMFTRLPPDPGGIIEAPVEKNVILALREQSINTARRGGWGGEISLHQPSRKGGGAIENMVFSGKRMGISLHQQIRRRGGGDCKKPTCK